MIHNDALQAEQEWNMSSKDAYQDACDLFCERYIEGEEVQINLDKKVISDWLWHYASSCP